ncbi:MAG TPA: hypothetical protein VNO26_03870 [Candidatus Limnocylindria bacterium]|nr:hypothetical protein [Candidatus Limnocylindria bacterium]
MADTRSARATRAQRRAEKRRAPAPPPAPARSPLRWVFALRPFVWLGLTIGFLVLTAMSLEHRITWYLAVDQFGYLRFANDLLHGRVEHEWPPIRAFAKLLPPQTDVLVQTYIWDNGRIYSRYAPGFPIILAAWIGMFGNDAAHLLNPTLFLAVLLTVMAIQWRLARSLWRGTIAATLVVLCPTLVHLWALTPTRDLSAHLCAFIGLAVLAGRGALGARALLGAGLALGYAGSIRPDAVLYLVPASILALGRWWPDRSARTLGRWAAAGALGVALGLAPSLAFYWKATGNPFVPTQGVELKRLFVPPKPAVQPAVPGAKVGYPPGWRGGTIERVQGGGLRLSNLPRTLPGNLEKIQDGYGPLLLAFAGLGAAVGLYLRPAFTGACLVYLAIAIPFFSCWTRPDHRYLIGVWLVMPMLITEGIMGTLELVHRLARLRAVLLARAVAVGAFAVAAIAHASGGDTLTPLPQVSTVVLLLAGASLVVAACLPARRVAIAAGPLIAVGLVWLSASRAQASLATRASFQRPQAKRAAATFRQAVQPGAVVITLEDVGRPMENIEYYAGVHSLYFTDLQRWRLPLRVAATNLILHRFKPYLLIPKRGLSEWDQEQVDSLAPDLTLELVADIPPNRNYDYFVAAAFHRGLPMALYRIRFPALENGIAEWEKKTGKTLDVTGRNP